MNLQQTAILIPAYNPDERLCRLIRELAEHSFSTIIVVNDGSSSDSAESVFSVLKAEKLCTVLSYPLNLGKGAALKLGLNHIFTNHPESMGVITADADGQHCVDDILSVARERLEHPEELILGIRSFEARNIPFRNRIGNKTTRRLMKLFLGISLEDTQTGLRAIPRKLIPELLKIPSNRYEFELEMLIIAKHKNIKIRETGIQTIYINGNESSHFNPILDSLKIYFALFRFIFRIKNTSGATDWNTYYSAPAPTAGYARRIVSAKLIQMIRKYRPSERFSITELGGGNSSFFERIEQVFHPLKYTVYDNNPLGISKFREKAGQHDNVFIREIDLLNCNPEEEQKSDIVLSVGLIEHFSPDITAQMIKRHFELAADNGIIILFFPTPTFLYRITRSLAEILRMWIFHDERPLEAAEAEAAIAPYGTILHKEIIWTNFLTQQIIIARKNKS